MCDLSKELARSPLAAQGVCVCRGGCLLALRTELPHRRPQAWARHGAKVSEWGFMVDIGAGKHMACGHARGVAPTITRSRGKACGYYLPWRRQRISLTELARLQGEGVPKHRRSACACCVLGAPGLPDSLIERMQRTEPGAAIGGAIGNGLSLNVVERVLGRLLYAANLLSEPAPDTWLAALPFPEREAAAV